MILVKNIVQTTDGAMRLSAYSQVVMGMPVVMKAFHDNWILKWMPGNIPMGERSLAFSGHDHFL